MTLAVSTDPTAAHPDRLVELVREGTLQHTAHVADDTTIFAVRAGGAAP